MKKRILICLFLIGIMIFGYKKVEEEKPLKDNRKIIEYVMNHSFQNNNIMEEIKDIDISWNKTIRLLKEDKKETLEDPPIIYVYNSHPTEEYSISTIGEYMLQPTVIMNNYILEDIWNKNGYKTYVEEKSVKDILNNNNWNYASSYKASRILLEERKKEYPSLKYFIDVHRDSLKKDRTTTQIGNKKYAQILFIVGLENKNYQENLIFTEKLVKKLDEKYPSLCKGIYKKEGEGVNGVYNQDFSPYTILIEIGGNENTTTEALNASIAFSKCFMEVINEEESA